MKKLHINKTNKKQTKVNSKNKSSKPNRKVVVIVSVILVIISLFGLMVTNYEKVLAVFGVSKDISSDLAKQNEKYSMLSLKENLYSSFDSDVLIHDVNTINILLFGLDEDAERQDKYTIFRPDTIILVSINFKSGEIDMVSVPRDTLVYLPTRGGKDKINTAFYYGYLDGHSTDEESFSNGVNTLQSAVSYLFGGLPINYYVGVNMDTAVEVIDAIGGVHFNLEHDVYLHGSTPFYKAANKVWSGEEFVTLARLRGYAMGDIGRTQMQQKLLKALFEEVKSIKFTELTKVIKLAYESIQTNIDLKTAISFVLAAMEIEASDIESATFPGDFGNYYGVSYWIVDQSQRVSFIEKIYGFRPSYLEQDERYKVEEAPTENPTEGEEANPGDTPTENNGAGTTPTKPTPNPKPEVDAGQSGL